MYRKKKQKKQSKSKQLFKNIKSNFVASGCYPLKDGFKIFYETQKGKAGVLNIPNPEESEIRAAFENSKISGFGKGNKNVVDENYRKACQILPQGLGFSHKYQEAIELISADIGKLMASNGNIVKAELIKLNVYGPGGFFKSHVDSPKGEAFGSLVIFLPNVFEGGVLNVQHEQQSNKYDFGGKEHSKQINWVAFYNDCVHQITQVKSGYRLTLSYNLFFKQSKITSVKANQSIIDALLTLTAGKQYIYYCEHYYGNNVLKHATTNPLKILKGKDAEIWLAVKQIKLSVQLNIFVTIQNYDYETNQNNERYFLGIPQKIQQVKAGQVESQDYGDSPEQALKRKIQALGLIQIGQNIPIEYLNKLSVQNKKYIYAIDGYYGNDYSINEKYCELVFSITVPE